MNLKKKSLEFEVNCTLFHYKVRVIQFTVILHPGVKVYLILIVK